MVEFATDDNTIPTERISPPSIIVNRHPHLLNTMLAKGPINMIMMRKVLCVSKTRGNARPSDTDVTKLVDSYIILALGPKMLKC